MNIALGVLGFILAILIGLLFKVHFRKAPSIIKLTIKSVIRWEQLNQKTFSEINYNDEAEIVSLFYVCSPSREQTSFKEFRETLKVREIKRMIKDFQNQTAITAQFQTIIQPTQKKKSKKATEDQTPQPKIFIKDIVATLIMHGLDASFALNEMELCDLSLFQNATDKLLKEKLTTQRLWTFLNLSPHLNKGAKPKDIQSFAWEELDDDEALTEEEIEQSKDEYVSFLNKGLKL